MNTDGSNDKPRLTAEQKKKNHIESEKKRREAIRAGFEKLANIVPGVQGQGRSEAVVLQATVQYLREMLTKKGELKEQALDIGMSEGDFEQMQVQQPATGLIMRKANICSSSYRDLESQYRQIEDLTAEGDAEDAQEGSSANAGR